MDVGPEAAGWIQGGHTQEHLDLERLFQGAWTEMVRLATFLSGSQFVAEDLVQDTFERLARRDIKPEEPYRYLRTSVVNACRSHHRRRFIEFRHRADEAPDTEDHPRELLDVLERLPMRERTAVVLRYYADVPEGEIAAILHCRPGTVRSLIQRALPKLKRELSS